MLAWLHSNCLFAVRSCCRQRVVRLDKDFPCVRRSVSLQRPPKNQKGLHSPTYQVRADMGWLISEKRIPPHPLCLPPRLSSSTTASSRSQWALPNLNRTTGLPQQVPDGRGRCRTAPQVQTPDCTERCVVAGHMDCSHCRKAGGVTLTVCNGPGVVTRHCDKQLRLVTFHLSQKWILLVTRHCPTKRCPAKLFPECHW